MSEAKFPNPLDRPLASRGSIMARATSAERKADNAVKAHLEEVGKRVALQAKVDALELEATRLRGQVVALRADVRAVLPRRARRRFDELTRVWGSTH